MNIAKLNQLAVRYHPCPTCGQPSQRRCREAVPEMGPRAWRYLTWPHVARTNLVDEGDDFHPGDEPRYQPPPDDIAARTRQGLRSHGIPVDDALVDEVVAELHELTNLRKPPLRDSDPPTPHCRHHLEFRSDCEACVREREFG